MTTFFITIILAFNGLKATDAGKEFLTENQVVLMALMVDITIYFLVMILHAALKPPYVKSIIPMLWILLHGCSLTILTFTLISWYITMIILVLWVFIFIMVFVFVPNAVFKKLNESESTQLNV
ncbi:hypothetical protein Lalb_Chr10g0093541 [Lupinus albus]|uniref:PGG domain-containing protein n=1 Tax=Lupinus albus TaxID=3870 RepID=A0A6A4PUN9_LUPAL|nr:hypothetical protein Lalb_Chr10g0093541 [Lupinus albus]